MFAPDGTMFHCSTKGPFTRAILSATFSATFSAKIAAKLHKISSMFEIAAI